MIMITSAKYNYSRCNTTQNTQLKNTITFLSYNCSYIIGQHYTTLYTRTAIKFIVMQEAQPLVPHQFSLQQIHCPHHRPLDSHWRCFRDYCWLLSWSVSHGWKMTWNWSSRIGVEVWQSRYSGQSHCAAMSGDERTWSRRGQVTDRCCS